MIKNQIGQGAHSTIYSVIEKVSFKQYCAKIVDVFDPEIVKYVTFSLSQKSNRFQGGT